MSKVKRYRAEADEMHTCLDKAALRAIKMRRQADDKRLTWGQRYQAAVLADYSEVQAEAFLALEARYLGLA